MIDGVCKLCEKEEKLHNSHIIPAGLYKRLKTENKIIVDCKDMTAKYDTSQLKDYLFCTFCESRFKVGEDIFYSYIDNPFDLTPNERGYRIYQLRSKGDGLNLSLFALGLLYRLHLSSGSGVDLGKYFSEIRERLLSNDACVFQKKQNIAVYMYYANHSDEADNQLILFPQRMRINGLNAYKMCLISFDVVVFLDRRSANTELWPMRLSGEDQAIFKCNSEHPSFRFRQGINILDFELRNKLKRDKSKK